MTDERPPVWVGHVVLQVTDLGRAPVLDPDRDAAIERSSNVAVLELRGGTHLVLVPSDAVAAGEAPFDLMVEDLDATHAAYTAQGLAPSPIDRGRIQTRSRSPTPTATGCT